MNTDTPESDAIILGLLKNTTGIPVDSPQWQAHKAAIRGLERSRDAKDAVIQSWINHHRELQAKFEKAEADRDAARLDLTKIAAVVGWNILDETPVSEFVKAEVEVKKRADTLATALREWFKEREQKGYMVRDEWEGPTNKALYDYQTGKDQP